MSIFFCNVPCDVCAHAPQHCRASVVQQGLRLQTATIALVRPTYCSRFVSHILILILSSHSPRIAFAQTPYVLLTFYVFVSAQTPYVLFMLTQLVYSDSLRFAHVPRFAFAQTPYLLLTLFILLLLTHRVF